jgi:hypothetical protein
MAQVEAYPQYLDALEMGDERTARARIRELEAKIQALESSFQDARRAKQILYFKGGELEREVVRFIVEELKLPVRPPQGNGGGFWLARGSDPAWCMGEVVGGGTRQRHQGASGSSHGPQGPGRQARRVTGIARGQHFRLRPDDGRTRPTRPGGRVATGRRGSHRRGPHARSCSALASSLEWVPGRRAVGPGSRGRRGLARGGPGPERPSPSKRRRASPGSSCRAESRGRVHPCTGPSSTTAAAGHAPERPDAGPAAAERR